MSSKGSVIIARLLDEYVAGCKGGAPPSHEALLARCPEHERGDLRLMLVGAEALLEHEWKSYVSPKTVEATVAAIHRIRYRKQRVREAEQRLAALFDCTRQDPIEALRFALDVPPQVIEQAQVSRQGGHAVTTWNRAQAGVSRGNQRVMARQALLLREQRLEEQAEALLERYDLVRAPVSLEALAQRLCLVVRDVALDEGMDGCLLADEDYGAVLLNRRIGNPQRRRFTLAHEIAHFVLHRKYRVFREIMTELGAGDDEGEEQEANIMASMLLLPTALLAPWSATERPTLMMAEELVRTFDVSLLAALRRIVRRSQLACALVVSKDGHIQWYAESCYFDYFIRPRRALDPITRAAVLSQRASPQAGVMEDAMPVPISVWVEPNGEEDEDARVWEESRYLPGGYVYSLITCL